MVVIMTKVIRIGGSSSKEPRFGKVECGATRNAFVEIGRDRIQYESLAIQEPVPSVMLWRASNASRPTC